MVDRETRDRLIKKLERIFDISNGETVNFLERLLDMVWSELILLNFENGD